MKRFGLVLFILLIFGSMALGLHVTSLVGDDVHRLGVLAALRAIGTAFLSVSINLTLILSTNGFRRKQPSASYGFWLALIGTGYLGLTVTGILLGHVWYEDIWAPMSIDQRLLITSSMHILSVAAIAAAIGGTLVALVLRRSRKRESSIEAATHQS